jgi:addiction module HigA family antidote
MGVDQDELGFPPPHPGAYLREDILPALNMTLTELADHLKVSRPTLSDLVHEKKSVSLEMAQRLGKAFGNGARFWLALQLHYDLWHAEKNGVDVRPLKWRRQGAANAS